MKLREIKTDKYTISSGFIKSGDKHQVYYEQWGNKDAKIPILLFHGGPGGGYKAKHKYSYDPKVHQLILFDQRSTGNSTPYGELEANTTQLLVDDAVKVLDELKIDRVYAQGGSWGSTMALLFSILHQNRVAKTIVNGVFTASKSEIDYVDQGIFRKFYPEVWERVLDSVPEKHKHNPTSYHYANLADDDEEKIRMSAKALEDLERPLLKFDWAGYSDIQPDKDPDKEVDEYDYVPYKIYAHYLSNDCFLEDNYILNNADQIKTPLYIVQGRYDMVCPPVTAYKLHKQAPNSRLYMTLASHDRDPEIRTALKTLVDTVFTQ